MIWVRGLHQRRRQPVKSTAEDVSSWTGMDVFEISYAKCSILLTNRMVNEDLFAICDSNFARQRVYSDGFKGICIVEGYGLQKIMRPAEEDEIAT